MILKLKEQRQEKADRFVRAFEQSRRRFTQLNDEGVRRVLAVVAGLREEIRGRILSFAGELDKPFLFLDHN